MKKFFNDDELQDVFAELNEEIDKHKNDIADDSEEMSASQRRYDEIIKKRKE